MRALLIQEGVPADSVIPDDGGVSTREAIHSARWFGKHRGWRRMIALSSPYHMYRIGWEARRQGLEIILCPALRERPHSVLICRVHSDLRPWRIFDIPVLLALVGVRFVERDPVSQLVQSSNDAAVINRAPFQ